MKRMFTPLTRQLILDRDEHKCVYCGKETNGVDHVIPFSEGGLSISANGVCCCRSCNSSKSTKLDEKWIIKGLQRLIQHGEDLGWLAGIRREQERAETLEEAKTILTKAGYSSSEVNEILQCIESLLPD